MPRVVIADDHEIIRIFIRNLVERKSGWAVCGEACDGLQAIELVDQHHPDIAVLDLSMKRLNGLEATYQIHRRAANTQVLIFSVHDDAALLWQVMASGAKGFVLKSGPMANLEAGLEALARHETYFSPEISEIMLHSVVSLANGEAPGSLDHESLTAREREVLQYLAEGYTNKNVATELGLSVATVQTHRATLMRKLKCDSIAKLVRYAVRNKIIEA